MLVEQLTFVFEEEKTVCEYEMLENIVNKICEKQNVDNKHISINETAIGGYSVWIHEPSTRKATVRVFKLTKKLTKKIQRYEVEVYNKRLDFFELPANITVSKNVIHFPIDCNNLEQFLTYVFDYELKKFEPSEKFGCCSKYVSCSDNLKCLHNDTFYARACYYKKNLDNGNIFYGINANC